MIDYMTKVKELYGYESLKTSYARKFPTLGSKNTLGSNMTENNGDDEEDNQADFISKEPSENQMKLDAIQKQLTEKESEVRSLSEKVNRTESLEKEVSEKDQVISEQQQKHVQLKLSSDLSLNKLCTAKQALDNFLSDNIGSPDFNEFHPAFKFIVAQYSSLLSSPDHYSTNPDNNEVTIQTKLFENHNSSDPTVSKNLEHFKDQLKIKLELDCAKRLERRNSIGRGRSNSICSLSKKRQLEMQSSHSNAKRSPSTHSQN